MPMSKWHRQQQGRFFRKSPDSFCKLALFLPFSIWHFRPDHISAHRQRKTEGRWILISSVPRLISACLFFQLQPLLFCGNLRFHLEDHLCQQLFAVLSGFSVDVAGMLFAVRPDGGVTALPQMVVDLSDAPSAWFAAFPLVRLEGAGSMFSGNSFCLW